MFGGKALGLRDVPDLNEVKQDKNHANKNFEHYSVEVAPHLKISAEASAIECKGSKKSREKQRAQFTICNLLALLNLPLKIPEAEKNERQS